MKITIGHIVIGVILLCSYCCGVGWLFPRLVPAGNLAEPVSLRDGSHRTGGGNYFLGRSHAGGGYRGGK